MAIFYLGIGQVVQVESTLFLAFQTLLLVNVMPPLSGRWFEESVWQCKLAINMMSAAHRAARTPFCPALRCRSCSNIFRQTYFVNWSLWCLHINHWFVMDTWSTGWGCSMICICNPCALCSFNIKTIWRYLSHWPPPFFCPCLFELNLAYFMREPQGQGRAGTDGILMNNQNQ